MQPVHWVILPFAMATLKVHSAAMSTVSVVLLTAGVIVIFESLMVVFTGPSVSVLAS